MNDGIIDTGRHEVKAKVNEDFCTGCGPCEMICPEVFRIENKICKVMVNTIPPEAEDRCYKAMVECPVEAIMLEW